MSTDEKITKNLIQTLEDGKEGFAKASARLADTNRADLCAKFTGYATQRETFATELKNLAAQYGDEIDKSGTIAGTLHRGWMALKDAIAGDAAMSEGLRAVVQRQFLAVKAAHDDVRDLRNAHA